jgi:hypothetical protein
MLYQMQPFSCQLSCKRVAGYCTEFPAAASNLPMCDDAALSVPPGLEPSDVAAVAVAGGAL